MRVPGLEEEFIAMDAFFDRLWHYQSVVSPKAYGECAEDSAADPSRGTTEEIGNVVSNDSVGQASCSCSGVPRSISGNDKNLQDICGDSESSPLVPVSGSSLPEESHGSSCNDTRGHDGTAAFNRGSTSNKKGAKQISCTRTELRNSDRNIQLLRKVFDVFDKNKDGQLSIDELSGLLKKLGLETSQDKLSALMSTVATQGTGYVDFNQFVSLVHGVSSDSRDKEQEEGGTIGEEDVEEAFRVFDMNGDGLISSSELSTVLSLMGIYKAGDGRDYEKMIEKVDLDGNGYIDIFEFKNMMHANDRSKQFR